jgi:putative acetyltransferase
MPVLVREARDDDAPGLIALVGGCFSEYPGCILDVEGELPELRAIASWAAAGGGKFHVGELEGRIVVSGGFLPAADSSGIELKKLYVDRSARRQGLGTHFVRLVEEEGRRRGARFVEMWSDTRFLAAHRLYEGLGYRRSPGTRALYDLSRTLEFHFRKEIA